MNVTDSYSTWSRYARWLDQIDVKWFVIKIKELDEHCITESEKNPTSTTTKIERAGVHIPMFEF